MIASRYRRFAALEAAGRSPLYGAIALAVAEDAAALEFLAGLPPARQQPNLLLATVRLVAGTAAGPVDFLRRAAAAAVAADPRVACYRLVTVVGCRFARPRA